MLSDSATWQVRGEAWYGAELTSFIAAKKIEADDDEKNIKGIVNLLKNWRA